MEISENYLKELESKNVNKNKQKYDIYNNKSYILKMFYFKQKSVLIHPNYISSIENKAKEEYESKLLSKKEKLIEKILQNRKKAIQTIIFYLMNFTSKNQFQKKIIISKILENRKNASIMIQSFVRRFLVQKEFNKIGISKSNYIFFYFPPKIYFKKSPNGVPKIAIQLKNKKIIDFQYSSLLHIYYIPLKKTGKREYRLNFIIDNNNVIDSSFPVELCPSNGNFYNIISSSIMYKRRPSRKAVKDLNKKWEKIFQIKNYYQKRKISIDNQSSTLSQNTDISAEINSIINNNSNNIVRNETYIMKPHKSILKKSSDINNFNTPSKKRVTFCTQCEYVIY